MSSHKEILEAIKNTQEEYKKINCAESIEQLMKYLKLTETNDENPICLKLINNQGIWKCKDCQKNKESIYCNECWGRVKDEHIKHDHNYEYIPDYIYGTCDCGNTNNLGDDYICPKHKKNSEENRKENSSEKKTFISIHKDLFFLMSNYISDIIDKNETNNELFIKNINTFIDYIIQLCFNNKIVLNWIAELLLKNYNINNKNVKHKCIDISIYTSSRSDLLTSLDYPRRKSLKVTYNNTINCTCPFLRYLMLVWKPGKEKCLLRFAQNYDLKKNIGILYLFLYDDMILKEKNDFCYLNREFLFSEIRIMIRKYNHLLDNLLNSPKLIIKYFISPIFDFKNKKDGSNNNSINNYYFSLKKAVNILKFDILKLLSEETKTFFISDDAHFYLSLIDVLAHFHNINSIKRNFSNKPEKTEELYNENLLQTELSLLDIFTIMTTIIDFENDNLIKKIFLYFNEKISKKLYKNIEHDEYSYHISLFRGFSIFLNRYCFFYVNRVNRCDFDITEAYESVKNLNLMPDFDECINVLFMEVSKFLRFFAACGENVFVPYGQSMKYYEKTYYYTYKFVNRDFSLMKYLIPTGSIKQFFSNNASKNQSEIKNGTDSNTQNNSSLIETVSLLKDRKGKSIKTILEEGDNFNNMRIISRLLSIILHLIRNNGSLIWNLGSSFKSLQNCQIDDTLLLSMIEKNLKSMKELTKVLILSKAIVKQNSVSFSELLEGIYYILRVAIGQKTLEEMVQDMFYSTKSTDQKVNYSIKDDYLSNIDTNYILSPVSKAKAEKYLCDFKKNKISIFNRFFYTMSPYEAKLSENIYKKIFSEENIQYIMDCIIKLVNDNEYIVLRPYFLNTLLNYFDIFYCLDFDHFKNIRNNLSEKINTFIDSIAINNLEEPYKAYCDLIVNKVKGNIIEIEEEKEKELKMKKEREKSLKERYMLKNKKFMNNMNINIINEDKKTDENEIQKMVIEPEFDSTKDICIFCKGNVNEMDLGNCFGKIGYFLLDKFNYNANLKIVNNLYNKYIKNDKPILAINNILDPKKEKAKKNLRIITCGHTIHFSCFYINYMKSEKVAINNFVCPVCKTFANTFFPKINHILQEKIIDKNIYNIFKGYSLDFVLDYRNKYLKNIKKFFEQKNKGMNENTKFEIYLLSEDIYKKQSEKNNIHNIKMFEEQKCFLKKNYNYIYMSCRHLIEGFFGIKENIYTNFQLESEGFNKIQKDSLLYCILQFRDFTEYFITSDHKKEQLFLWKNLLLSFRLMLKLNILRDNFYVNFSLLLYRMCNLNQNKNISTMINNDQFNILLSGILFLTCVFFEYQEIEGYEKYIIYMFLPIYSFSYYFRKLYLDNSLSFIKEFKFKKNNNGMNDKTFMSNMNEIKFFEFLSTDKAMDPLIFILKKIVIVNYLLKNIEDIDEGMFELNNMYQNINLSQLKQKNVLQILDELDILINKEKNEKNNQIQTMEEEPQENIYNVFFNFFKSNNSNMNNYKNVFNFLIKEFTNEIKKELCPKTINPNLLAFCEEIKYKFIYFPENAVDFLFEKYNFSCEKCKSKGKIGLICLDCGRKVICKSEEKAQNNNNENQQSNFDTFFKHVELCGGGTGAFINILDLNIIFVQQNKFSQNKIPLYLDIHGEPIKENSIHKDFSLNKIQLNKARKKFYNNDLIFG